MVTSNFQKEMLLLLLCVLHTLLNALSMVLVLHDRTHEPSAAENQEN